MNCNVDYVDLAKAALEEHRSRKAGCDAKEAKEAKKVTERGPLPPVGDPRRPALELIDRVWSLGARLVVERGGVHAAPADRVPAELAKVIAAHQAELVAALTRLPGREG